MNTEAVMTAFEREPTEIKLTDLDYRERPFDRWVMLADAENRSGRFWITMTVKDSPKVFYRKWLRVNLTVAQIDDITSQIKDITFFPNGKALSGCGADAAAAEFAAYMNIDLNKMRMKNEPLIALFLQRVKQARQTAVQHQIKLQHAKKVAIKLGNEVHRLRGEKPYDEIARLMDEL